MMVRKKQKLTRQEEFEILKLVLDKFLWAGLFILLYGLWSIMERSAFEFGFWVMIGGSIILLLFMGILVKEYEIIR